MIEVGIKSDYDRLTLTGRLEKTTIGRVRHAQVADVLEHRTVRRVKAGAGIAKPSMIFCRIKSLIYPSIKDIILYYCPFTKDNLAISRAVARGGAAGSIEVLPQVGRKTAMQPACAWRFTVTWYCRGWPAAPAVALRAFLLIQGGRATRPCRGWAALVHPAG